MLAKLALATTFVFGLAMSCAAQEDSEIKPMELDVLKGSIGVWDAEIEVWPQGLDKPAVTFKGVETNRAYGEHWIASDFDSEFMGQTMKIHSIVGYDLDQKRLVGTVIDHGPYAAQMTGDYDQASKTVTWMTAAKDPNGNPMSQRTLVTQKNADQRVLVLMVPKGDKDEFTRLMRIRFVKRK